MEEIMKKKYFVIALVIVAQFMSVGVTASILTAEPYNVTDSLVATEIPAMPITESETENAEQTKLSEEDLAMQEWVENNKVTLDAIPEFDFNSLTVYSDEEALEKIPFRTTFLPTYRAIYYWEPTFLSDLVNREDFNSWYKEVVLPNIENNTEPQEMYTVSFVKYFQISKDDFDKACEARKLRFEYLHDTYGHDISLEGAETPNSDIIYTFDNKIINAYFRR